MLAAPDLVVESVDAPSAASVGDTISVLVTYKNQGTDLTRGSYVVCRMIISPDKSINLADNIYEDENISNTYLKAGFSVSKTYNYTLQNDLEGTYYIGAYVDAYVDGSGNTYHAESNENNNANYDATPLIIARTPDREITVSKPSGGEIWNAEGTNRIEWSHSGEFD